MSRYTASVFKTLDFRQILLLDEKVTFASDAALSWLSPEMVSFVLVFPPGFTKPASFSDPNRANFQAVKKN